MGSSPIAGSEDLMNLRICKVFPFMCVIDGSFGNAGSA